MLNLCPQIGNVVVVVYQYDFRLVGFKIFFIICCVSNNDDLVTFMDLAGRRTVKADVGFAAFTKNDVRRKTLAVVDFQ